MNHQTGAHISSPAEASWGVVAIGNVDGATVELVEGDAEGGGSIYELEIEASGAWKVYIRVDSPAVLQLLRSFLGSTQPGGRLTLGYLDHLRANLIADAELPGAWKLQVLGQAGGVLFEQRWSPDVAQRLRAAVCEAIDTSL
jgi:hypothetical protein